MVPEFSAQWYHYWNEPVAKGLMPRCLACFCEKRAGGWTLPHIKICVPLSNASWYFTGHARPQPLVLCPLERIPISKSSRSRSRTQKHVHPGAVMVAVFWPDLDQQLPSFSTSARWLSFRAVEQVLRETVPDFHGPWEARHWHWHFGLFGVTTFRKHPSALFGWTREDSIPQMNTPGSFQVLRSMHFYWWLLMYSCCILFHLCFQSFKKRPHQGLSKFWQQWMTPRARL